MEPEERLKSHVESKDWEDISLEATFPSTYIIEVKTSKPYDVKQYIILILQIHTFHMHCESQPLEK